MSGRRKASAVQSPAAVEALPALSLKAAAARLGLSPKQLQEVARRQWWLEPTYSVEEVAAHLGCGMWQVHQLVRLGRVHGAALHVTRGGLYPTFKTSPKSRRIPLSALERHKRHMTRAHDGAAA